jgi:hypothetical protein
MRAPRRLSRIDPAMRSPMARSTARDGGWHRYEHDLVALADDSQHSMAVLFTKVGDVHAGCFGDPQPKEAEQADEAPRPP